MAFISSVSFCQDFQLDIEDIVGADTAIYLVAGNSDFVTVDFSNFNADDATLDLGHSDDRVSFLSASITGVTFPLTLSKVTYTKTANGYTRHRIAFIPNNARWSGTYIVMKLTKNSVTAGTFKAWK